MGFLNSGLLNNTTIDLSANFETYKVVVESKSRNINFKPCRAKFYLECRFCHVANLRGHCLDVNAEEC